MTFFLFLSSLLILISLGFLLKKSKDLPKWQSTFLAIAAPLLVALIYQGIGTPEAFKSTPEQAASTQQNADSILTENQLGPEQIQRAITSLQSKVEENPKDIESLNLLANTYLITEQTQLAVLTLEKLIVLGQNDPDTLVKAADAYAFVEQGVINLRAQQLLETALKQNPDHPQGLWLSGMAAIQAEQLDTAKTYWSRLLPLVAGSPQEQQLRGILADLEQRQSAVVNIAPGNVPKVENNANKETQIVVNVSLSETLRKQNTDIQDTQTVFVFAQAKRGPKAPLAVKRLTVADLPTTITLTEQDAMLPQATISQFQNIALSAKISVSGNPTVKEGDIESDTIDIDMQQQKASYSLEIN